MEMPLAGLSHTTSSGQSLTKHWPQIPKILKKITQKKSPIFFQDPKFTKIFFFQLKSFKNCLQSRTSQGRPCLVNVLNSSNHASKAIIKLVSFLFSSLFLLDTQQHAKDFLSLLCSLSRILHRGERKIWFFCLSDPLRLSFPFHRV